MSTETTLQIEKIALFLGQPWKVCRLGEPSPWRHKIIDGKGRCLYFRVGKGRFNVMGIYPSERCKTYNEDYKSISVSISRPAKDIVADIKRRLLPFYLKQWPITVQRYQDHKRQEEQIQLITQALKRVAGGHVVGHGRAARTLHFEGGSAEIWNNLNISLSLQNLTVEQAIKIVAIIQNE